MENRTTPMYVGIAETLKRDIVKGEYGQNGAPMPSMQVLSEMFGVSRLTLRQALLQLRHEGFVDVRQGKRTTVRLSEDSGVTERDAERNFAAWRHSVGILDPNFPRLRPLEEEELDPERELVLTQEKLALIELFSSDPFSGLSRVVRVVPGQGATTMARFLHKRLKLSDRNIVFLDWSNERNHTNKIRDAVESSKGKKEPIVIFDASDKPESSSLEDTLNQLIEAQGHVRGETSFSAILFLDKDAGINIAFPSYYRPPIDFEPYEQLEVFAMIVNQHKRVVGPRLLGSIADVFHSDLLAEVREDLKNQGREFNQVPLVEISEFLRKKVIQYLRRPWRKVPFQLSVKSLRLEED